MHKVSRTDEMLSQWRNQGRLLRGGDLALNLGGWYNRSYFLLFGMNDQHPLSLNAVHHTSNLLQAIIDTTQQGPSFSQKLWGTWVAQC